MKKIQYLFIVSVLLFGYASIVRAATYNEQVDYQGTDAVTGNQLLKLGTPTSSSAGNSAMIGIFVKDSSGCTNADQLYISQYSDSAYSVHVNDFIAHHWYESVTSTAASTGILDGTYNKWIAYDFSNADNFDWTAGQYYALRLQCTTGPLNVGTLTSSTSIPAYIMSDNLASSFGPYFVSLPPAITLSFPSTTSTIPDFTNWVVLYASSTYPTLKNFGVRYSTSESLLLLGQNNFDDIGPALNGTSTPEGRYIGVTKSVPLAPAPNANVQSQKWYAYAYYTDEFGNVLRASGITSFTVSNTSTIPAASTSTSLAQPFNLTGESPLFKPYASGTIINVVGTSTPSTVTYTMNCDDNAFYSPATWSCWFMKGLLGLGQVFFSPSQSVLDRLAYNFTLFKGVFPFKIIFNITDNLQYGLSQASSTDAQLTLVVPAGNLATSSVTILTSSTLQNAVGKQTKDFIFNLETSFFWILAAVICVKMIS